MGGEKQQKKRQRQWVTTVLIHSDPEPKSIKPRVPLVAVTSEDENKYAVDQKAGHASA